MNQLFDGINNYVSADEFFVQIKKQFKYQDCNKEFTLGSIDVDNFNYINDLAGVETGDKVLRKMAEHFSHLLLDSDFFTRLHADLFAFCLKSTNKEEVDDIFSKLINCETLTRDLLPFGYRMTVSGGLIVVDDFPHSLSTILDKANYARQCAKRVHADMYYFYDKEMSNELQWRKSVIFSMEAALENHQFEMYLQPKIIVKNDKVAGVEALVRWNHPQHGMIEPNHFIPIMEQSGFIQKLDFFMLKEACLFLKECAEKGIPQLPISVNFSKVHLTNSKLVEDIFQIVNQAEVNTSLIEIEFTESIFVESFDYLVNIVSELKSLGFNVSLDDFGNAYSSLNCLKELPIDIIKIDKGFLQASSNTEKGRVIITKVIEMIKSLRMLSIMEGVETVEQVEFLRKLSCDFAQGYFYAKPMPRNEYLLYLKDKGSTLDNIQFENNLLSDDMQYSIPDEFQMDNWELYMLGKNIDMGLMKGYLDGDESIQYVNDRVLEYLGYTRKEFREKSKNGIVAFTHPDDIKLVQANVNQLIKTGKSLEFESRAIRKDGKVIILQGRSSSYVDNRGRTIGLFAFQDVTDKVKQIKKLEKSLTNKIKELEETVKSEQEIKKSYLLSEQQYRVILEQSEDIMFDWNFLTDIMTFSDKYKLLFGVETTWKNPRELSDAKIIIHPSDVHCFKKWLDDTIDIGGNNEIEFRYLDANNNYIWLRARSTVINDFNQKPLRAVGLFSNIDAQKNQIEDLIFKSQRDSLTKALNRDEMKHRIQELLNTNPNESGAFLMIDIDNFKALNDNLGHQLGDTVLIDLTHKLIELLPINSIVGRMGGDELGAYLPEIDAHEACKCAETVVKSLRLSYYGSMEKYNITTSLGIALYPICGNTFDDLYYHADIALYESKHNGKDRFTMFTEEMTNVLLDNRTPVECSEGFLKAYFQEDFPFKIFEMLYETKDIDATIFMILRLLGERFKMDRVYIFQNNNEKQYSINTYEWCAPGIKPEINELQHVPFDKIGAYFSQYNDEGVFCCPDINKATKDIYEICEPQGIKSMLHCSITNEGEQIGFIGFDMCTSYHDWLGEEIAILGYISRILSIFLIKSDISLQLKSTYQNYIEMIENLSGFVYVVDVDTYELLYVNKATKSLNVELDHPCYKMAFGSDSPCPNCPMKHFSKTTNFATEEIYSEILQRWISASASKIRWEGKRNAGLVSCTDISKYKS